MSQKNNSIGMNEDNQPPCVYYYDEGVSYHIDEERQILIQQVDGGIVMQFYHEGNDVQPDFAFKKENGTARNFAELGLSNEAAMVLWLVLSHMADQEFYSINDMAGLPNTIDRRTDPGRK